MVAAPPESGNSNQLADWLELEALGTASGRASLVSVNQSLEIAEDLEPEELDHENLEAERRVEQVVAAVEERVKAMGDSYPFRIDHDGTSLAISTSLTPGGYSYLFCLIVSSAANGGPLSGGGGAEPDLVRARGLFQVCATVAVAGLVTGPSYSVGWPRPDSSTFLAKLAQVYSAFGDGKPFSVVPPGAPSQVKDDEIDVIAWRDTRGTRPPAGYYLGQAASGANWNTKSLKGSVDQFHATWFAQVPASNPSVGTIIPFVLPSDADAAVGHVDQEAVAGELRRMAARHGDVVYRHRVAMFVDQGLSLAAGGLEVERAGDLADIQAYVNEYRGLLTAAMSSS